MTVGVTGERMYVYGLVTFLKRSQSRISGSAISFLNKVKIISQDRYLREYDVQIMFKMLK